MKKEREEDKIGRGGTKEEKEERKNRDRDKI